MAFVSKSVSAITTSGTAIPDSFRTLPATAANVDWARTGNEKTMIATNSVRIVLPCVVT